MLQDKVNFFLISVFIDFSFLGAYSILSNVNSKELKGKRESRVIRLDKATMTTWNVKRKHEIFLKKHRCLLWNCGIVHKQLVKFTFFVFHYDF